MAKSTSTFFVLSILLAAVLAEHLHTEDADNLDIDVNVTTRITGGYQAILGDFPYMAALKAIPKNAGHWCGAIILTERIVITAAHCFWVYDYENKTPSNMKNPWMIMAGHHTRWGQQDQWKQSSIVETIRMHPMFKASHSTGNRYLGRFRLWEYWINDIAVLLLKTPLKFNKFVNRMMFLPQGKQRFPGCRVFSGCAISTNQQIRPGTALTVPGWGSSDDPRDNPNYKLSPTLQRIELPFVPIDKCRKLLGKPLMNNQLCAGGVGGKGPCQGDCGGPLIVDVGGTKYVVGIGSFPPDRCGQANKPTVFTDIRAHLPWIQQTVRQMGLPPIRI